MCKANKITGRGKVLLLTFQYQMGGRTWERQAHVPWKSKWQQGRFWTKETSQSSLGKDGIGWEEDPPKT